MQIQKPTPLSEARPFPLVDASGFDDEMDIIELLQTVWHCRWLVLLITGIFALGSIIYALSKPDVYRSSVLLAPANEENDKMGQLVSQFGGLASLAGVNLGNATSSPTDLALAVLSSRQFITEFVQRRELKVPLFAGKKWDEKSGELLLDSDIYDVQKQRWVRKVEPGKSVEPSDWEVFEAFKELVTISTESDSGMVTASIEFLSPIMASQWVGWLIADLNKEMREKDLAEVEMKIDYLQNNLAKIDLADVQAVFYQLIEEQLKTKMLAQLHTEYSFKTVDPAVIAEEKSSPNRAFIVVSVTLLGGMLAVMLVLAMHAFKNIQADFKQQSVSGVD